MYKQVISLIQYGGTDPNQPDTVRQDIKDDTTGYVAKRLEKLTKAGVTRFLHWNPFGHEKGKDLFFSDYLKFGSLNRLKKIFDATSKYPNCEHIVYHGKLTNDSMLVKRGVLDALSVIFSLCDIYKFRSAIDNCYDNLYDTGNEYVKPAINLLLALKPDLILEPGKSAYDFEVLDGITVAKDFEVYPSDFKPTKEHIIALLGLMPPSMPGPFNTSKDYADNILSWANNLIHKKLTACFNFNDYLLGLPDEELKAYLEKMHA